jgi:hypothetical protein
LNSRPLSTIRGLNTSNDVGDFKTHDSNGTDGNILGGGKELIESEEGKDETVPDIRSR